VKLQAAMLDPPGTMLIVSKIDKNQLKAD